MSTIRFSETNMVKAQAKISKCRYQYTEKETLGAVRNIDKANNL